MSFPKIPDIDPYISITFEDAINLLLTSIALEEVSLSKLIDAETNKILCVLNHCKCKDSALQDAIAINKSVDDTIKNIIKLQMLLQFKLENVRELLPSTTTTTTSTSTTTTTTCTKTTTCTTSCTTSTRTTTTKCECGCNLVGKGVGCVSNCCDEFYGQLAVIQAFLFSCDVKNRTLRYSVQNDDANLRMYATSYNINIECPSCHNDKVMIFGKGHIEKKTNCDSEIVGMATFTLIVCDKNGRLEFKMVIKSDSNPELNHDSGFVKVKNKESDLHLEFSC